MQINITSGTGTGPTKLSAFDNALYKAGISNYNLITLSSIIPEGSVLIQEKPEIKPTEFGHKLYIVLSQNITDVKGQEIWAGLGWIVNPEKGNGIFVEHHGQTKKEVQTLINNTLNHARKFRKDIFGDIEMRLESIKCENNPVCALVAAVYKSEGWDKGTSK